MKKEQEHSISSTPTPEASAFGVLFTAIWIMVHCAWGMMAFMGNVMSLGALPEGTDAGVLIFGMIIGQVIAGLAGFPGGAAFYRPGHRKRLLMLFFGLFVTGALIQVGVFVYVAGWF